MRVLPLALLVALGSSLWAAETESLPARLTRQAGEVVIEYSAGDEAYVDAFIEAFPNRPLKEQSAAAQGETQSIGLLEQHRAELLQQLAKQLAMKEPSGKMTEGYDSFTRLFRTLQTSAAGAPHRYALWRKPELIARLKRGEAVSNFALAGPDEVEFTFNFEVSKLNEQSDDSLVRKWRAVLDGLTLPVQISTGDDSTPAADIAEALKTHDEMLAFLRNMRLTGSITPFVVLHEAAEMGIVDRYIASADRRWFCDGVANYLAFKALEKQFGPKVAKSYYNLEEQLVRYAAERPRVDLEAWPAAENEKKVAGREDLGTANYAYATKVIADVCAKHGDDILPKLFAEIGRTPKDKTNIKTVYKAFKKLTREDLRDYLPKPEKETRRKPETAKH